MRGYTTMKIELTKELLAAIHREGEQTYPHECCGFLLGRLEGGAKVVTRVEPVVNARDEANRHNRYLIGPDDFLRAEKAARAEGLDVVGFYHSHPDVEAKPSAYDTEYAWPWYSYVIVSVVKGKADHTRCWVLRDDRSGFEEEVMSQPCQ
jgi:proteasome lid subunit RPN8/RPN11